MNLLKLGRRHGAFYKLGKVFWKLAVRRTDFHHRADELSFWPSLNSLGIKLTGLVAQFDRTVGAVDTTSGTVWQDWWRSFDRTGGAVCNVSYRHVRTIGMYLACLPYILVWIGAGVNLSCSFTKLTLLPLALSHFNTLRVRFAWCGPMLKASSMNSFRSPTLVGPEFKYLRSLLNTLR